MGKRFYKSCYLLLVLIAVFCNCRKSESSLCDDSTGLYTFSEYPVGVAVNFSFLLNNEQVKEIVLSQFNSITPENLFKAENLHPLPDVFEWEFADSLSNFCLENHKRLHGHTLIWHNQLPSWISAFQGNSAEWDQLMKTHIQTIVSHFKGKVAAWDVVNEAFNDDGTLRNTIWRKRVGDNYIEKAFIYAREADPDVLLFYNEYGLESNPAKRKAMLGYFNSLRNRGIQVDGIGLQMHINIASPEASQVAEAFTEVYRNDYKIHLSEMDISVNPFNEDIDPTQELFEEQANLLGKIILHYNQVPAKYQYGITFWGISDNTSWIMGEFNREDYPLLYDDHYMPKPAYCKLKQTL